MTHFRLPAAVLAEAAVGLAADLGCARALASAAKELADAIEFAVGVANRSATKTFLDGAFGHAIEAADELADLVSRLEDIDEQRLVDGCRDAAEAAQAESRRMPV